MNTPFKLKTLLAAASVSAISIGVSQAAVLLTIDLSVTNKLTVTATTGLSSAADSGNPRLYLQNFFTDSGVAFNTDAGSSTSDFTNIESGDASNGTVRLLRGGDTDAAAGGGLGIFNWTNSTVANVTAGTQAFTGSATVTLTDDQYADLKKSNTSGDIYFPAVVASQVPGGVLIGQYEVTTVPEPGTTLLSCLGLGAIFLRRKR